MGRPKTRKQVDKICETCGKNFSISDYDDRRGRGKFCSMKCARSNSLPCDKWFLHEPSSEMAWVLGLLFSDGCLIGKTNGKRQRVSLKSIDYQVLETAQSLAENESKIYYCGLTQAGKEIYRIDWSHPQIVSDAIRWGMHSRKTFTVRYPIDLPDCFAPDFIRGLFDGDGHVSSGRVKETKDSYYRRLSFLGTVELMSKVSKLIPIDVSPVPYRKISKIRICNLPDMKRIYDFMYYDRDVPCLLRKREAFDELLSVGSEFIDVCGFSRMNSKLQEVPSYTRKRTFYGKRSAENRRKKKKEEEQK